MPVSLDIRCPSCDNPLPSVSLVSGECFFCGTPISIKIRVAGAQAGLCSGLCSGSLLFEFDRLHVLDSIRDYLSLSLSVVGKGGE